MSSDASSEGVISSVVREGVTHIGWSRAQKKNAFNSALAVQLASAISTAAVREECAVIELSAEGSVFCAGWDLDEIRDVQSKGRDAALSMIQTGRRVYDAMDASDAIVVAVVNGPVFGFGVGMLCHADVVIAREGATIGLPELKAGVVPASVLADLIGAVGPKLALKWCTDGRVAPHEALASGLISAYVPATDLESTVAGIVEPLTSVHVPSLRATKKLARDMKEMNPMTRRAYGEKSSVDHLVSDHG